MGSTFKAYHATAEKVAAVPTPQHAAMSVVQAQSLIAEAQSIAPVMVIQQVHTAAEWYAGGRGLCDCFSDWEVCFWGTFFSPCLYGQLKARSGRAGDCYSGCCELTSVWVAAIVTTSVLSFILQFAVIGDLTTGAPHNMSALQGLALQIPALVNFLIVGVSRAHLLPPEPGGQPICAPAAKCNHVPLRLFS